MPFSAVSSRNTFFLYLLIGYTKYFKYKERQGPTDVCVALEN